MFVRNISTSVSPVPISGADLRAPPKSAPNVVGDTRPYYCRRLAVLSALSPIFPLHACWRALSAACDCPTISRGQWREPKSSIIGKNNMFCVSYAEPVKPQFQFNEKQEEIYSSLRKVRNNNDEMMKLTPEKHVTMIPLGSPRELLKEKTVNGTMIRVTPSVQGPPPPRGPMTELVPKMRPKPAAAPSFTSDPIKTKPEEKRDFEGWSGRFMEGRVLNGEARGGTNAVRGYWERNIQMEQRIRAEEERRKRPKGYGFPKWRSTDALSASLVASNNVQIPVDSRIPEERLRKMEETEREAVEIKKEIQEEAEILSGNNRKLSKGKSLDSLNMQVETKQWYDAEKIKSAVSRESIANIALSREFFENASQRDWRSSANSRRDSICSLSIMSVAPPLPPKSDAIQIRQAAATGLRSRHDSYSIPYQPHQPLTISSNYDVQQPTPPASQQQMQLNQHQQQNIPQNHIQSNRYEPQQQLPQQTSINRLLQQDSPQTADPIEQQEVLLMLYLKQNMDIVQGLGIHIPQELLAEMEDLQMLPVELRICEEEPLRMFSPVMKNGRYQRKPQPPVNAAKQGFGSKYITKKVDARQAYSNHLLTDVRRDVQSYGYRN
ncbi:unnamed protein product [Caenorhabditis bovis]|uniref:Uncharacterized protein n=1 Tax=Caenorhabditis bovis TaxID=2654633 RepID=A0A8S1ETP0_9PELO|nr:unnamed protein product [Caenorhabditis bovis]